ncbi:peptidoglycan DD-metalloendopeptidase family protein [Glaciecola sp. XM2]|uniref:murein hydrolase activator EnvC family protein n=1 Tax=Glaciecola sp. XM2 TaxID=1914931 RepID=UPI001BDE1AB5|nr:peptidoglycan DD-metalloendopeptidase family protein [Glaciecola sp. XM2]MBT1449813.1 peptidoglycan DD-metalloendopeptidase family protein [Glaciecola sp. XM2]
MTRSGSGLGNRKRLHAIVAFYRCALFIAFCIIGTQSVAQDQSADLENIKSLIEQTRQQLEEKLEDSERLQQELKLAELQIAESATQLNQTDRALATTRSEITDLEKQRNETQTNIDNQQAFLANQIKSAFMAGNYDFAKMVFNQDDASKFERVLTYYQYLNSARQEQITQFRELIASLESLKRRLADKEQQQILLIAQQRTQAERLRERQQARQVTLRDLDAQIKSDQARVAQLEQQERSLTQAIERAEIEALRSQNRENVEVELVGLTQLKGQLLVPTSGQMNRLFGKRRQGQVRWKGIIINSSAGTPVNAVADGKILYADWLKGFGLVTIVDHGKGYMSVYGRNQALLRNVGDNVVAGDTISLVGNSGGQAEPGLYFEIRHKGKALNPSLWLKRR